MSLKALVRQQVQQAQRALRLGPPMHLNTPLVRSDALSAAAGCRVWLKLENLQPTGSFKLRGMGAACQMRVAAGATRLISSSGGNAGMAVAYAGRALGVPVLVVVPVTTSERARRRIASFGATVVVHGAAWHEAHAHALSLLAPGDTLLHPFDDPQLWAGHASLVDELALQAGFIPDAVVVAVGGGGLLAGVVEGLDRQGWMRTPVIAVETEGADALNRAVLAGERVSLEAVRSVATSLGARQVCERAFELTRTHAVTSVRVSDTQAVDACLRFLDDHHMLVEPACGAALAVAYEGFLAGRSPRENVVIVVCGGVTASFQELQQWQLDLH
jgi:L-serine/L-threonine ammonia-lyase